MYNFIKRSFLLATVFFLFVSAHAAADSTDTQSPSPFSGETPEISPNFITVITPEEEELINQAINESLDAVDEYEAQIQKKRWEKISKKYRVKLDEKIINLLLGKFFYSHVIEVIAQRLTNAAKLPTENALSQIYSLLVVLHIYLAPDIGIRTIHLGLQHKQFPALLSPKSHVDAMNGLIQNQELSENIDVHLINLPQALQSQTLFDTLSLVNIELEDSLISLKEMPSKVAVMLTAITFNLWKKAQHNNNYIRPSYSFLTGIGQLLDTKTCLRITIDEPFSYEDRTKSCLMNSIYISHMRDPISEALLESGRGDNFSEVRYQWGYTGAAIRMMNKIKLPRWVK